MTNLRRSFPIVFLLAAFAAPSAAQAPAKKEAAPAAPAPTTAPPAKKIELPSPPPNFEYAGEGRRDPFVSLEGRGTSDVRRADGAPGLLTNELTIRGIVFTRGAWVAMVSGPDTKLFTVRTGEKLADGVIQSVSQNSVVILQEVNDPLSLEKLREVRKFLRGGEEVK
jgi:Tfp pilus assembly protein PilP